MERDWEGGVRGCETAYTEVWGCMWMQGRRDRVRYVMHH